MSVQITQVTRATPDLAAFLHAHHAELEPTAPAESRHALVIDRLLGPDVRLFVGRLDDRPVVTGAVAVVEDGHEELKSMRTDPLMRGRGLGKSILAFLVSDAASRGIRRLSLETGSADFFAPARAMYAAAGFRECEAFGDYASDPHSTFMMLALPAVASPSRAYTR